eukprot:COSAG06_NODE_11897_length_1450_cov_1.500370_2_plen_147_part_00
MPWEDIRFWAYNSLVDNGTHILLYYYVISTGDPAMHPPPPGVTQTYTCLAISADRGAEQQASLFVLKPQPLPRQARDKDRKVEKRKAFFLPAGRSFTKPNNLGAVSWNGSKNNNIVWPPEPAYGTAGHETGTVFIDTKPGTPPEAK